MSRTTLTLFDIFNLDCQRQVACQVIAKLNRKNSLQPLHRGWLVRGRGEERENRRWALLNASLNRLRMTLNHLMLFASHCGWRQVKDIDVAPTLLFSPPSHCTLPSLLLGRSGEARGEVSCCALQCKLSSGCRAARHYYNFCICTNVLAGVARP